VGILFRVKAGSTGAHQLLSKVARVANGELAAAAHAGVEGVDLQVRERRSASEVLSEATAWRFHGVRLLSSVRPSRQTKADDAMAQGAPGGFSRWHR
jgi:hypothetical protein